MEKFGSNEIITVYDFYPSIESFLNENDNIKSDKDLHAARDLQAKSIRRIPTNVTVQAMDGTKIDMKSLDFEMESARTAIVSQSPLFAPYIHHFTPIYTWLVPTMATDGIRLFVNPQFANELSWEQKIFVMIHEIMHCVLLHMERGRGFDGEVFNAAGDFEINALILDTISDFNEAFIRELQGLFDDKFTNWNAEKIYREILQNGHPQLKPKKSPQMPQPKSGKGQGKGPGQGQGGGENNPPQIEVGSKVRIKATGEKGIVTAINPDGTFEIDPLNESVNEMYQRLHNFLNETFTREEIVPISDGGDPGEGEGGSGGGESEQEDGSGGDGSDQNGEDGTGDGPDQNGEDGTGDGPHDEKTAMEDAASQAVRKAMEGMDPGNTGSMIDKAAGDKIAQESGYDVNKDEAGDSSINPSDKWRDLSSQMYDDLKKGGKNAGSGKGGGLLKKLSEIHKSEVNWKSVFKRAVKKALSAEQKYRVPHKKHLGKDYVLRGLHQKRDAIQHIVVAVDVSGSMSDKTLQKIINEVNALIFTKKVKKITLLPFDGGVDENAIQTITRTGKAVIKQYRGPGGGTNFQAPLDWVHENLKDAVSLLVFFTDGFAPMPKKPPYFSKFIWMVYDDPNFKQPFGQLVTLST
jgi:predicted metal-dependent peptidase